VLSRREIRPYKQKIKLNGFNDEAIFESTAKKAEKRKLLS
jgi:hypothetical protein